MALENQSTMVRMMVLPCDRGQSHHKIHSNVAPRSSRDWERMKPARRRLVRGFVAGAGGASLAMEDHQKCCRRKPKVHWTPGWHVRSEECAHWMTWEQIESGTNRH